MLRYEANSITKLKHQFQMFIALELYLIIRSCLVDIVLDSTKVIGMKHRNLVF